MAKVTATISRASLAKVARDLEKEADGIVKLTQKQLGDIARVGKQHAEELLDKAEYDGSPEDARVILVPESGWKWEIFMAGPAAMSIEYGATGKNQPHNYWFFSARGRDVTLKAGGAHAHYRRYIRSEREKVDYGNGKFKYLDARDEDLRSRPKRWIPEGYKSVAGELSGNRTSVAKFIPVEGKKIRILKKDGSKEERNAGYGLEDVEKPNSYITKGNRPHNIMGKTFQYMVDEVEKLTK